MKGYFLVVFYTIKIIRVYGDLLPSPSTRDTAEKNDRSRLYRNRLRSNQGNVTRLARRRPPVLTYVYVVVFIELNAMSPFNIINTRVSRFRKRSKLSVKCVLWSSIIVRCLFVV